MYPSASNETGNLNNQPYNYITADNRSINTPIINEEGQQFTQQNVTSANICDDNDTSDDDVIPLKEKNLVSLPHYSAPMEESSNSLEEKYVYEEVYLDNPNNYTSSTPSYIDYPTTPTSEETSTPPYLMSEEDLSN